MKLLNLPKPCAKETQTTLTCTTNSTFPRGARTKVQDWLDSNVVISSTKGDWLFS